MYFNTICYKVPWWTSTVIPKARQKCKRRLLNLKIFQDGRHKFPRWRPHNGCHMINGHLVKVCQMRYFVIYKSNAKKLGTFINFDEMEKNWWSELKKLWIIISQFAYLNEPDIRISILYTTKCTVKMKNHSKLANCPIKV